MTENSKLCLATTLFALGYEEESVKKFEVDANCSKEKMDGTTKAIENDVSFLKKLESMNNENIVALSKEIDPDAPVKNFTSAQLKEIEESGNFSDVASTKPYYSVLEAGISFMPEYDSEGKNQGFKESNFFAVLRLNNRKELEFPSYGGLAFYQALDVAFYSAPIACPENNTDENCKSDRPDVTKLKFRDISNTVNASVYGAIMYGNDSVFGNWEIGNSIRYGALNRDKRGPDGDSVAKFYNYGFEMRLNDFLSGNGNVRYLSGMPKFMINYSEGKNEDFAGAGVKTKRKIASFNYRIFDNQPVFIGLIVDGGKGPDTIALNLSYGLKASSIFGLFAD